MQFARDMAPNYSWRSYVILTPLNYSWPREFTLGHMKLLLAAWYYSWSAWYFPWPREIIVGRVKLITISCVNFSFFDITLGRVILPFASWNYSWLHEITFGHMKILLVMCDIIITLLCKITLGHLILPLAAWNYSWLHEITFSRMKLFLAT